MVDNLSPEERSHIMSLVKPKNTKPEWRVRSFFHKLGFRYRLHVKGLPGKPDLVFPKYKTVIFVNGCFWHGHEDLMCKLARLPKFRIDFWKDKINRNQKRDKYNIKELERMGWRVLIIWECRLGKKETLEGLLKAFKDPTSRHEYV